jgi:hypothetical protein
LLFAADLAFEDAEPAVPVLPDALTVPDAPAVPVPDEPALVEAIFAVTLALVDAATAAPRLPQTPLTSFAARAKKPRRIVGLSFSIIKKNRVSITSRR